MCTVSDKIILCTCEVSDISSLKNYWCLFRFNPEQELLIIGQPINPYELLQYSDPHNPVVLCNKLNEGNLFDKPIEFKEKDRLQISIHFKGNEYATDYGFEYKKGKWKVIDYETFDWLYKHEEFKQGKIKNAIARGNSKQTKN